MRKRTVLGVAAILSGLFWPWTEQVLPGWTVSVRTPDGQPIVDVQVSQTWQHQTLEAESHSEVRRTDSEGLVVFPTRHRRASALQYAVGAVRNVLRSSHEASFGPYGFVIIGIEGTTKGCDLLSQQPNGALVAQRSECVVFGSYRLVQLE